MAIATGVTEARIARGLTILALSKLTGQSRVTIYAAERGDDVNLETLVEIARALDVPLSQIAPDAAERLGAVL